MSDLKALGDELESLQGFHAAAVADRNNAYALYMHRQRIADGFADKLAHAWREYLAALEASAVSAKSHLAKERQ